MAISETPKERFSSNSLLQCTVMRQNSISYRFLFLLSHCKVCSCAVFYWPGNKTMENPRCSWLRFFSSECEVWPTQKGDVDLTTRNFTSQKQLLSFVSSLVQRKEWNFCCWDFLHETVAWCLTSEYDLAWSAESQPRTRLRLKSALNMQKEVCSTCDQMTIAGRPTGSRW